MNQIVYERYLIVSVNAKAVLFRCRAPRVPGSREYALHGYRVIYVMFISDSVAAFDFAVQMPSSAVKAQIELS